MATFGRRASTLPQRTQTIAGPASAPAEHDAPANVTTPAPAFEERTQSVENELREWKAQRSYTLPWRQISLMASACFGIASFALPDTVNDAVNWILYGLMAISFYVGISGWIKKKSDAAEARVMRDSTL